MPQVSVSKDKIKREPPALPGQLPTGHMSREDLVLDFFSLSSVGRSSREVKKAVLGT